MEDVKNAEATEEVVVEAEKKVKKEPKNKYKEEVIKLKSEID